MTFSEFAADVKAKAEAAAAAVESFLGANPDIEADAAGALRGAVSQVSQAAVAEVAVEAPRLDPDIAAVVVPLIGQAISRVDDAVDAQIAALQVEASTKKSTLAAARAALAPAPAA